MGATWVGLSIWMLLGTYYPFWYMWLAAGLCFFALAALSTSARLRLARRRLTSRASDMFEDWLTRP
jgi:hypothetical protein